MDMKNHKTEILSKTLRGYTLWCQCCHDIQIGFGNMLVTHSKKKFYGFKKFIDGIDADSIFFDSPLNKPIYFNKDGFSFGYCLSKDELIELKELLEDTVMVIKLKEVVQETLLN